MSKIERGFYPLSQIEDQGVPKIELNLNLPDYVDKDRIGVNLKGIYQMMRLGGIKTLHVTGQAGETSSYTPDIVGRDKDGHAIAGRTGIEKKVPSYSSNSRPAEIPNYSAAIWYESGIRVNLSEITDRITSVRSTKEWSSELNKALKQGIVESGLANVVFGNLNAHKMSGLNSIAGAGVGSFQASFLEAPIIEGTTLGIVAHNLLANGAQRLGYHSRKDLQSEEGFRWSLFYGPQLDRAVALKAMAKTRTLVKEIPGDSSKNS